MRRTWVALVAAILASSAALAAAAPSTGSREFAASPGGKLTLKLATGAGVKISGSGGASVVVDYVLSCKPECAIDFDEAQGGIEINTRYVERKSSQTSNVSLEIRVPSSYDVEIDSMGGELSIQGVEGRFSGRTMGGDLDLREVRGTATLETMGGGIELRDARLDGSLKTMGGDILFENVEGDVRGSSMGGNIRYKNVRGADGKLKGPSGIEGGLEVDVETVQISTMGGEIAVDDAPAGADVMTMGGEIEVRNAKRFVRATTMGGDIRLASVDGWVKANTMGGDLDVTLVGAGGDVDLSSQSGEVILRVPPGYGMRLDLEIAFTKNSRKDYRIEAPGGLTPTVTPEWDHQGQSTPHKYIRMAGAANGGGVSVKVRTVNGNISVVEGGAR